MVSDTLNLKSKKIHTNYYRQQNELKNYKTSEKIIFLLLESFIGYINKKSSN